jgi:hypothetical protein
MDMRFGTWNVRSLYRAGSLMITLRWTFFEIGVSVVDWIGLAQDRYRWKGLVNSVMNLRVP